MFYAAHLYMKIMSLLKSRELSGLSFQLFVLHHSPYTPLKSLLDGCSIISVQPPFLLTVLLYCYDSYYMLTESMSTGISHSLISSVTTTFSFTYWKKVLHLLYAYARTHTQTLMCAHACTTLYIRRSEYYSFRHSLGTRRPLMPGRRINQLQIFVSPSAPPNPTPHPQPFSRTPAAASLPPSSPSPVYRANLPR